MLEAIAKESKQTHNEFYDLADDFVLDLTSVYHIIQDDFIKLLNKAYRLGWTEEQLLAEIEKLL